MLTHRIGHLLKNRYRIDAFLGRGGMAEVYRVWDQQRVTSLAMKVLHADLAHDKVFLRRFQREAQTLARLQHPHIVRFYGLEQDGDFVFLLMDFVDGHSLREEIFRSPGSIPLERIIKVARPVCAALSYAHTKGFVHCDVKPANIMIEKSGRVLVSDFGIARMTESATTTTLVGAGTPAYMAPEQVRGEQPTPQTDIYSWGIILYEMLTGGERPFTGEHASITGSTGEKVRWEQLQMDPPSPRNYNPDISVDLEGVVLRCLEKDPAKRFSSAKKLLDDLEYVIGPGEKAFDIIPAQPDHSQNEIQDVPSVSDSRRGDWRLRQKHTLLWISVLMLIITGLVLGNFWFGGKGGFHDITVPMLNEQGLFEDTKPQTPTHTSDIGTGSTLVRPSPTFIKTVKLTPRAPSVYEVEEGDTLFSIAEKFGVDLFALIAINNLDPTTPIYIGDQLVIPSAITGVPKATVTHFVTLTPETSATLHPTYTATKLPTQVFSKTPSPIKPTNTKSSALPNNPAGNIILTIKNGWINPKDVICNVMIRGYTETDYTKDLLKGRIFSGQSQAFSIPSGTYDIRIENCKFTLLNKYGNITLTRDTFIEAHP